MRRGILRSFAAVVAVAAALLVGLSVAPVRSAPTDARFADSELASATGLKTTALPTVTFSNPSSVSGTTLTASWAYTGPALPGQTTTFTAVATGLVLLGTYTITPTVVSTTGGLNTVKLSVGGLPTGIGGYEIHATTSVGGWSAGATNHAAWSVTCALTLCSIGAATYPSGS